MEHHHTPINIDVKPQIEFPCVWSYRVIGFSRENVLNAIQSVFQGKAEIASNENVSKKGKYVALNCSITVQTDEERLAYFEGLTKQDGIIMVI